MLVFFHGGRYEQGSEGVELYDGSNIANISSTIVVTVRRFSQAAGHDGGRHHLQKIYGPGCRFLAGSLDLDPGTELHRVYGPHPNTSTAQLLALNNSLWIFLVEAANV